MDDESDKAHKERYAKTWGTPIGQDCITLKASLAAWLGPRLVFLADHTTTVARGDFEADEELEAATKAELSVMRNHGKALIEFGETEMNDKEAQEAMLWVAENFHRLWD
ncbi:hypothetical protein TH25_21225 [Thalassospira profundimaris]|uniref:Uncharacterized protein n=1 Tax=Thalassospira profundimaris TaxID=502049 RepID=A0A367WTA0_9PROT|nr:hypothetical protein [Thalassospira profundimaris]RCK43672.1 hypothetical protein TH25_21225 [Thalassospira profundimaris]